VEIIVNSQPARLVQMRQKQQKKKYLHVVVNKRSHHLLLPPRLSIIRYSAADPSTRCLSDRSLERNYKCAHAFIANFVCYHRN
jgi:hypothetical protein